LKRVKIEQELEVGSRVKLYYDEASVGNVKFLGPEQSQVKFDSGQWRIIPNGHLRLITEPNPRKQRRSS